VHTRRANMRATSPMEGAKGLPVWQIEATYGGTLGPSCIALPRNPDTRTSDRTQPGRPKEWIYDN
jgi:hypothetical protein